MRHDDKSKPSNGLFSSTPTSCCMQEGMTPLMLAFYYASSPSPSTAVYYYTIKTLTDHPSININIVDNVRAIMGLNLVNNVREIVGLIDIYPP